MKNIALTLFSALLFTGCAAGIDVSEPVEKKADLISVCVKEKRTGLNFTDKEVSDFLVNSLAKKNINANIYKGALPTDCQYELDYRIKGKKELIVRGRLVLLEYSKGNEKIILGQTSYKYRGEAKEIAQQTGIQGQFDLMVGELFKNF